MKNFQSNLLIALAVALCALCAWQWYFQTTLRKTIDHRGQSIYHLNADIQGYTNSIKSMSAEIDGLQARVAQLKTESSSNSELVVTTKRALLRLQIDSDVLTNEIAQYQTVTNLLVGELRAAYDGVKKQNEAISKLVAQRDEFVRKYNDSIKARNELTEKYNALVERFNKQQQPAGQ